MAQNRIPFAGTLLAALSLALPAEALGQIPGPDHIEILRSTEGTQVLFGGIGVGMAHARAAERLGGGGTVYDFFGGGPLIKSGVLDGLPCDLTVFDDRSGNVRDFVLTCEGERAEASRLLERFRAALAVLPSEAFDDAVYFAERDLVVGLSVHPRSRVESSGRAFARWEFWMHVYDRKSATRTR